MAVREVRESEMMSMLWGEVGSERFIMSDGYWRIAWSSMKVM